MKTKSFALSLLLSTSALLPFAAHADMPGQHPEYLHALTDLRDARWNLEHRPGDAAVSAQEDVAITEVDRAIDQTKKAARADGKDMRDHPGEDANMNRPGRLHHALDLLGKTHNDLARPEDNPEARELKNRILEHVDLAIQATKHAIGDVEHHN